MSPALPTIMESAAALQHRFSTEQDPQRRQRRQALYLVASGPAPSRLARAELLAGHRHTVRAGLAISEKGGLNLLLTRQKAPDKRSALTPAVRAKLQTRVPQPRGFGSSRELQQYLASAPSVHLAYGTVHGIVRSQLQANPKAPRSPPQKTCTQGPSVKAPCRLSSWPRATRPTSGATRTVAWGPRMTAAAGSCPSCGLGLPLAAARLCCPLPIAWSVCSCRARGSRPRRRTLFPTLLSR